MFVSHRGMSLCCLNEDRHKDTLPSEFWYGDTRKNALEKMHNDKEVKGCDICYRNEKNNMYSLRKLYHKWHHVPVKALPTMLDIDLSNFCNLKCVMCSPNRSSQHAKDVGLGVTGVDTKFIDDLVEMSGDLTEMSLQGGEPTLMPEYEYYFEKLKERDLCKNIKVDVITNLTNTKQKFYQLLKEFKEIKITVSVDAYGTANEYVRWPSKFEAIENNFKVISEMENVKEIDISHTVQLLSMFNYGDFLKWIKKIEEICTRQPRTFRVSPIPLNNPVYLNCYSAPESLKQHFANDVRAFFDSNDIKMHNTKTELQLLCRRLKNVKTNDQVKAQLLEKVTKLDTQRQVKIEDYIPNFWDHYQKSQ